MSRSSFKGNKTVLSQFTRQHGALTRNMVRGDLNIYFSFHEKLFCKITFHGLYGNHDSQGKKSVFTFHVGIKELSPLCFEKLRNEKAGAPNENIVQNHLSIALLNVF